MSLELLSGEYLCSKKDASSISVSENNVHCQNFCDLHCSYVPFSLADLVDDPGKGSAFFGNKEDPICDVWKDARKSYRSQTLPKCTDEKINLCGNCIRQEKPC
jgi:hypothetical protein